MERMCVYAEMEYERLTAKIHAGNVVVLYLYATSTQLVMPYAGAKTHLRSFPTANVIQIVGRMLCVQTIFSRAFVSVKLGL